MSVLESVRKVQGAEAEAGAIVASSHDQAAEELDRAQREAARLVDAARDIAREGFARLREQALREEERAAGDINEAARVEMAEIRSRADRNRAAATAALTELVARVAENGG